MGKRIIGYTEDDICLFVSDEDCLVESLFLEIEEGRRNDVLKM